MSVAVGVMVGLVVGDGVNVGMLVWLGGISVQVGGRTTLVFVGWMVLVALGEKSKDGEQLTERVPEMEMRMMVMTAGRR